uniref:Solute carrier family 25 member 33-like isoform X2 n=1 Tax=Geotrypetes seraphini TaxID=260995 RepID=A0A6P8PF82_GEOSA|nr:solute carrier family 25 member 33-like isoform X2 [Geotrypetes seraphini]
MAHHSPLMHLIAGGCGGTAGAIVTVPLEVIKTRLQSSDRSLHPVCLKGELRGVSSIRPLPVCPGTLSLLRAIYFATYSGIKETCNDVFFRPESKLVHMVSATSAGFVSITLTNPIWLLKTRMQLESREVKRAPPLLPKYSQVDSFLGD